MQEAGNTHVQSVHSGEERSKGKEWIEQKLINKRSKTTLKLGLACPLFLDARGILHANFMF